MTERRDPVVFSLASDAAPGLTSEDFALVSPELAVVVDGAGVTAGGCAHGVAWYCRQLATHTMDALISDPGSTLADGLARGIHAVSRLHVYSCDLDSDTVPCAAVGILRLGAETVDTLALSDCTVVVDTAEGPQLTCDLAIQDLAGTEAAALAGMHIGSPDHQAALDRLLARQTATRNRDGGWWVAASDPQAAYHARTDSYPRAEVRRAVAFTDGATRPVDQLYLYAWPQYLDLLDKLGPAGLVQHVRSIESSDPDGSLYPRGTTHDDATVAHAVGLTPDLGCR